ncbi:MAG: hypothetical protein ACI3VA_10145 [Candidatus Limivicinus sp.]
MKLMEYDGERVKIINTNNQVFRGTVTDYIFPEDNEPEEESIILRSAKGELLEFYKSSIKTIEISE